MHLHSILQALGFLSVMRPSVGWANEMFKKVAPPIEYFGFSLAEPNIYLTPKKETLNKRQVSGRYDEQQQQHQRLRRGKVCQLQSTRNLPFKEGWGWQNRSDYCWSIGSSKQKRGRVGSDVWSWQHFGNVGEPPGISWALAWSTSKAGQKP